MAGYSSTPLAHKLGVKPAHTLALFGAPEGFPRLLEPLPPGVTVRHSFRGRFDVGVVFVETLSDLKRRLGVLEGRLDPSGGLWVAWRKGKVGEVSESAVREHGLMCGLVDNKVCAIDEAWSGLRFVRRLADRPPRTPTRATRKRGR